MTKKRSEITIILKIPHYYEPKAWVAYSDNDIIEACFPELTYESWTKNKVLEFFNENDDVPEHLKNSLKNIKDDEEIIYIAFKNQEGEFYKKDEAPTMLEAAKSFIGYDMHSSYILTVEEAKDFIKTYKGHNSFEAKEAVRKELKYLI